MHQFRVCHELYSCQVIWTTLSNRDFRFDIWAGCILSPSPFYLYYGYIKKKDAVGLNKRYQGIDVRENRFLDETLYGIQCLRLKRCGAKGSWRESGRWEMSGRVGEEICLRLSYIYIYIWRGDTWHGRYLETCVRQGLPRNKGVSIECPECEEAYFWGIDEWQWRVLRRKCLWQVHR